MSRPAMVGEVNKLACGLLAERGVLFLPSVGSLVVERRGAQRLSRHSVLPPCRVVTFTSQEREASLVDAIADVIRLTGGDQAQAQTIYDRWLSYAMVDGVLTIDGVGVLKQKHFTSDPGFDKQLNPQGHLPVQLKPVARFDWVLWLGVVAILFAAGLGGSDFLKIQSGVEAETPVVVTEVVDYVPTDSIVATPVVDSMTAVESATPTETVVDAPVFVDSVEQPAKFISGHRYVVLGVFSSPENAVKAMRDAETKVSGMRCSVYVFGDKFLVSPFNDSERAPCAKFVNDYNDHFPELWVYTAR